MLWSIAKCHIAYALQERGEATEALVATRAVYAAGRLCRVTCCASALALPGAQQVIPSML